MWFIVAPSKIIIIISQCPYRTKKRRKTSDISGRYGKEQETNKKKDDTTSRNAEYEEKTEEIKANKRLRKRIEYAAAATPAFNDSHLPPRHRLLASRQQQRIIL
ncbi:unnamed protein product [Ceratitis capitata]|uniref:(Mediterranean fruit fly) hypothetical protein n=1 Tax=Ceratitis capitata TaxID=7213 RepID=A0A811V987_CERCA|nr:unnamed protein product [Ceratitis capitata]